MSTSASGKVVDENGAGLSGLGVQGRESDRKAGLTRERVGAFSAWTQARSDEAHPKPRLVDNYRHAKSEATVRLAALNRAGLTWQMVPEHKLASNSPYELGGLTEFALRLRVGC